jgi:hypothetical protein
MNKYLISILLLSFSLSLIESNMNLNVNNNCKLNSPKFNLNERMKLNRKDEFIKNSIQITKEISIVIIAIITIIIGITKEFYVIIIIIIFNKILKEISNLKLLVMK